jgi:2-methylisocitrate lyase-like PEP mutase family enzyme
VRSGSILKTGRLTGQRRSVISLTPPTAFGRREAARAAAVPIVINAHTDLYLRNVGDEAARFDETVSRGKAYLAAGRIASIPIHLRDPPTIARLVKARAAPINIDVRAGLPSVAELEALRPRARTRKAPCH